MKSDELERFIDLDRKMRLAGKKLQFTLRDMQDDCVCEFCRAQKGKIIEVPDIILGENVPPYKQCTCDKCRCRASMRMV